MEEANVNITQAFKNKCLQTGFIACGIAKATTLPEKEIFLNNWISCNFHGDMQYLQRSVNKRTDPAIILPGVKSIIVLLTNYYPSKKQKPDTYQIAKYAYGQDYHHVLNKKTLSLIDWLQVKYPESKSLAYTDTGAILEKHWATIAGLGWIGNNTLLIHPTYGSFNFLSVILTTIELNYDHPFSKNLCASCNKCIEACPTKAITEPHVLNATRCLSYMNNEAKREIPEEFFSLLNNRLFGCDICQDVCPFNQKLSPTTIPEFQAKEKLFTLTCEKWKELSEEEFLEIFTGTPLERTGYKKITETMSLLD